MRAVPRCRKPVGDGAMRVRTVMSSTRPGRGRGQVFRSSTSSRPTARRIMPCVMPAARRWSSLKRPWDVLAGCVIVVLVSPRLAVIEQMRVASITANAAARPPPGDERDHGAALPGLLRHGQRMLRVARAGSDETLARPWADLKPMRHGQCARTLRMHADRQRLHALQHHPGIEGRQAHAGAAHGRHELFVDQRFGAAQGTRNDPALAVEELRARDLHDDVGAELDRLLERRRTEAVVDAQQRTGTLRDAGQRCDVADLGQRVGRCLQRTAASCWAAPLPATRRHAPATRTKSARRTSQSPGTA